MGKFLQATIIISGLALLITGCSPSPTATPTRVPTLTPAPPPSPTTVPTATLLPTETPAPTLIPTDTPVPPTHTPTRKPTKAVTPKPKPTATNTAVAFKYSAPELMEPGTSNPGEVKDQRKFGDTIVFVWRAVAQLGENECYAIHIVFVNPNDNRHSVADYLTDCQSAAPTNSRVKFNLYAPVGAKKGNPNYQGLIAYAGPESNRFVARWTVTVVRNTDPVTNNDPLAPNMSKTIPLSPASAVFEFPFVNE
jgi:hypothetical protein